jgi:DNA-binding response OmpR family regulator
LGTLGLDGMKSKVSAVVIDSNTEHRNEMAKILTEERFSVTTAATGDEGVLKVRENNPSIIILDFLLKDMSCFEVVKILKSDAALQYIPVILTTNADLTAEEKARISNSIDAVIMKSAFSHDELFKEIRRLLEGEYLQPVS